MNVTTRTWRRLLFHRSNQKRFASKLWPGDPNVAPHEYALTITSPKVAVSRPILKSRLRRSTVIEERQQRGHIDRFIEVLIEMVLGIPLIAALEA